MKTPLYPIYSKYHGKVVDFHGWDLPVQFSGIIQEHLAVRNQVGLFDVSHMGEVMVVGPDAALFLDSMVTNLISTLQPGGIRYSPLCYENGGTVDDLLVYCLDHDRFLLVVNASNIEKDFEWLRSHSPGYRITLENISDNTAQLAIQGPNALPLMEALAGQTLTGLKYYNFLPEITLHNIPVLLSRTGYTGEDGFEIYLKPEAAPVAWEMLMEAGAAYHIMPIGLGARDTLRFEASLPLYGQELSPAITPLEAGLGRFVKLQKSDFIGAKALQQQYAQGMPRQLVGLEMIDRGIPRSEYHVLSDGKEIGVVTSGSYCPSLEKNLAMALIATPEKQPYTEVQIEVRGKLLQARVITLPFYTRPKGAKQ